MKIAVIGAGISGLTVVYRLHQCHDITLYEAGGYLGGHANTVDVSYAGEQHAIDTGFVVFNAHTYPQFTALLSELNVATRSTSMSFSVRCDRTGLEYCGSSLAGLFVQKRNLLRPRFYQMLRDIVRFNREAVGLSRDDEQPKTTTVREFLTAGRYSREFRDQYLLPMGSAIWSCPAESFAEFPVRFVAEFFQNHGLLSLRERPIWSVIQGGSRAYVNAMLRRFREQVDIRLRTPVQIVRRDRGHVEVTPCNAKSERFDHVVFACHADQALRMLVDPTRTEREVLGAFPYERNVALLHTDSSVLPQNPRAWASWNCRIPKGASAHASVTYCMNILQHVHSRHVFNVTLNGGDSIDPAKVLGRFVYEHPVFTTRRDAAQTRHRDLLSANRSSFCGAYWRNGFHEDGVVSALMVCGELEPIPNLRISSDWSGPDNGGRQLQVVATE